MKTLDIKQTIDAFRNNPGWLHANDSKFTSNNLRIGVDDLSSFNQEEYRGEGPVGFPFEAGVDLEEKLKQKTSDIMAGLNVAQQQLIYRAIKKDIYEPLYGGHTHAEHPENAEYFNYMKGLVGSYVFSPYTWYNTGNTVEWDEAVFINAGNFAYQATDYFAKQLNGGWGSTTIAAEFDDFLEQGLGVIDAAEDKADLRPELLGQYTIVNVITTRDQYDETQINHFPVCAGFSSDGKIVAKLLPPPRSDSFGVTPRSQLTASEICLANEGKGVEPPSNNVWEGGSVEASVRVPTEFDLAAGLVTQAQFTAGVAIAVGARSQGYITAKITHNEMGNQPYGYTITCSDGGEDGTVDLSYSYYAGDPTGESLCTVTTTIGWGSDGTSGDSITAHSSETGNFYEVSTGSFSDTSNNCRGGCWGPTTGGSCEEGGIPIPFEETVTIILIPVTLVHTYTP